MKFNRVRKHSVRFTPKTDINSDSSNFIAQEKTKGARGEKRNTNWVVIKIHEFGSYRCSPAETNSKAASLLSGLASPRPPIRA